jgi:hypothetical protein
MGNDKGEDKKAKESKIALNKKAKEALLVILAQLEELAQWMAKSEDIQKQNSDLISQLKIISNEVSLISKQVKQQGYVNELSLSAVTRKLEEANDAVNKLKLVGVIERQQIFVAAQLHGVKKTDVQKGLVDAKKEIKAEALLKAKAKLKKTGKLSASGSSESFDPAKEDLAAIRDENARREELQQMKKQAMSAMKIFSKDKISKLKDATKVLQKGSRKRNWLDKFVHVTKKVFSSVYKKTIREFLKTPREKAGEALAEVANKVAQKPTPPPLPPKNVSQGAQDKKPASMKPHAALLQDAMAKKQQNPISPEVIEHQQAERRQAQAAKREKEMVSPKEQLQAKKKVTFVDDPILQQALDELDEMLLDMQKITSSTTMTAVEESSALSLSDEHERDQDLLRKIDEEQAKREAELDKQIERERQARIAAAKAARLENEAVQSKSKAQNVGVYGAFPDSPVPLPPSDSKKVKGEDADNLLNDLDELVDQVAHEQIKKRLQDKADLPKGTRRQSMMLAKEVQDKEKRRHSMPPSVNPDTPLSRKPQGGNKKIK